MNKAIIIASLLTLAGCTNARISKFASYGSAAHVQCYSGERLIYDGFSTGKVLSEQNSDGYFFRDRASGKAVEVSGNCIITYIE